MDALLTPNGMIELDISSNCIGSKGMIALAPAVATLQVFSAARNDIGDDGVKALAGILCTSKVSLKDLDLSENKIGSRGGGYLGEAIKSCGLQSLNIQGNKLGSGGAHVLIMSIRDNATLTWLNLSKNEMESRSGLEIGEALKV